MPLSALFVFAALAAPAATPAREADSERIRRVEEGLLPMFIPKGMAGRRFTIAERMKAQGVPGMSIAVIEDGKIAWARAYGVTAADGTDPVTTTTLFQAGSVSKPVAAVGALRAVEEGKLRLDQDVNQLLKGWKVPENEHTTTEKVTVRRLLSHSAGLTVHGFPGYAPGVPVPTVQQVLDGVPPANTAPVRVNVVPGGTWRYSGGGYTVMQLLLEDVTGTSFTDLLRRTVLAPLGMKDSTYAQPLPAPLAKRAASGHRTDGGKVAGRFHTYPEQAAAGLWTTPTDLARFAIGVQKSLAGGKGGVLRQETARQMLTVQSGTWGLGPQLRGSGEALWFMHGGRDEGFDCMWMAAARTGQGAVIMVNANNDRGLIKEVMDSIAAEYRWPGHPAPTQRELAVIAPGALKALEGTYTDGGRPMRVYVKDGSLFLDFRGFTVVELLPESETEYFLAGPPVRVVFEKGPDGAVTEMKICEGMGEMRLRRSR